MTRLSPPPPGASQAASGGTSLVAVYAVEAISSICSTSLTIGIFFFMQDQYGWGLKRNFALAVGQGATYMLGALLAGRIERRLGRRAMLAMLYAILAGLCAAAAWWGGAILIVSILVAYTMVISATWPVLESLVSVGVDAHVMSRRIGVYNLVWSGVSAATVALTGTIIQHWPVGVLMAPAALHGIAALVMLAARLPLEPGAERGVHLDAEPELLRKRTLAMWLSRIAMPSTYVVIYAMAAMMPLLPVLALYDTGTRTVIGSAWLVGRWLAFAGLAMTAWWHTRPLLLLFSTAAMLVTFIGVGIRASDLPGLHGLPASADLGVMIGSQMLLGVTLGVIYAGSLYFGMALSSGSTEHGGYHEALIGLGCVLGPGVGALTQVIWPGNLTAGVWAVSGVVGVSLVSAIVAAAEARRRRRCRGAGRT